MKSKLLIVLCVLLVAPLYLAGCYPHASETVLSSDSMKRLVNCDTLNEREIIYEEVVITLDDTLTVALCSNPTSGFEWLKMARISNPSVVIQTDHNLLSTEATNGVSHGADMEQWTFKPINKGMTFVYMDYSQPWDGGEKKAWTYTLLVTVK